MKMCAVLTIQPPPPSAAIDGLDARGGEGCLGVLLEAEPNLRTWAPPMRTSKHQTWT
jgi:hypothetical protein